MAITTFRLTVEAHKTGRYSHLKEPRETTFTVLTGDTLFFGPDSMGRIDFDMDLSTTGQRQFAYSTEDKQRLDQVLMSNQYDAVVGNPPYIKPKDPAQNKAIRQRYKEYCKGTYALTVPFTVKFFRLAKKQGSSNAPGWVGQITANTFMQREFGKPLIEQFFREVELREIIDTSGAYIPGHGTPTVIVIGRNCPSSHRGAKGILGITGEPTVPKDPANGLVWRAIVNHADEDLSLIHISEPTRRS